MTLCFGTTTSISDYAGHVEAIDISADKQYVALDWQVRVHFQRLASEWEHDIYHVSSMEKMRELPSFQALISLGKAVVPFAVERLKRHVLWILVLEALLGKAPFAAEGKELHEIKKAWLSWARKHGYLTSNRTNQRRNAARISSTC
ncbi:MAG: hypothetical protein J5J06_07555 [Phycisphaerae bacterium]|nr:hypothetical protein [Phycisphaerae bacterium]